MSYIIKDNTLVCKTENHVRSSAIVRFSHCKKKGAINTGREWMLCNSEFGKISNAKKWGKKPFTIALAEEINHPGSLQFYIL